MRKVTYVTEGNQATMYDECIQVRINSGGIIYEKKCN